MVMEQPQGRAVLTLSAAGSPRLWLWGDALQRTRGGIFSEGGRDELFGVGGGRQSAEAAEGNCSPGREKHLNLPCFCRERVVASTEREHGHAG